MFSQAVNLLNTFANSWGAWIAVTFVNTAILLAVVGAIWLVLRRRLAPQIGYWLFLLVPLKLLVPMQIGLPVALPDWPFHETTTRPDVAETVASSVINTRAPATRPLAVQPSMMDVPMLGSGPAEIAINAPEQVVAPPPVVPVIAPRPLDVPEVSQIVSPAARLSLLTIAMLVWAVGTLAMIGCWLARHWRFHRQLKTAKAVDPDCYSVDFAELCRRAGIAAPIRVVESERVLAPAVTGIFRRTMILPVGLANALTPSQIEWAILHELAHIRRWDLAVILPQRLATILHFFNPAIWIANRLANQLREYACDDLASDWTGRTPAESGEAFVEVLRYARRRNTPAFGLGILGLDARSARSGRVRRMLDRGEGTIKRPGRWSVLAICLVALLALPHLRAANEETSTNDEAAVSANPKNTSDETPRSTDGGDDKNAAPKNTFELLVLGPDGEPVSGVVVEFRHGSRLTEDDVFTGEFIKQGKYGTFVETSAKGRIVLERSRLPRNITFAIEVPGFTPFWYGHLGDFPRAQPTTDDVTVHLDGGWSVGSVIVDSTGNPVPGVQVRPGTEFQRPPGQQGSIGVGTRLKTDKNGRWRYDSAPNSADYVFVEIYHPRYQPKRIPLPRAEYGIKLDEIPKARVTLNEGITVRGRVTNEAGEPIEGALVRIDLINDEQSDRTNAEGSYELIGCEPRVTQIAVSADGMAIDAKTVNVRPDMAPVNFQMKPGGTVRIRVLDHQGNPVPKARIFFQRWRDRYTDLAFDRVDQYANKNGVWVWHEAPHDTFTADICGTGMDLSYVPLIAREKEYVFKLPPALVISGQVVNAKTKEAIQKYKVVPGRRSQSGEIWMNTREKLQITDGTYQVQFDRQYPGFFVRVEAPGYIPATSRELEYDEGNVTIDFALKKGTNIAAQVRTPDGEAAADADVVLGLAGSQIMIENGRIKDRSTYHVERRATDEQGRFQFPPQASTYQLVILHPSGYAHVIGKPGGTLEPITLTAWARIEGTYFKEGKPRSGIPIAFIGGALEVHGPKVPSISTFYEAKTGPGGKFVFGRVVPERIRVGRQIVRMVHEGAVVVASSKRIPLELKAGQTYHIQLGAKGRPLVGQLVPPADYKEDIIWSFAEVELRPAGPPRPDYPVDLGVDPEEKQKWFKKWRETPEGEAWAKAYSEYRSRLQTLPRWSASVDRHGRFQINSVTPGEYWLNASFGPGRDETLHIFRHGVTVGPTTNKNRHQPINLGKLTLKQ